MALKLEDVVKITNKDKVYTGYAKQAYDNGWPLTVYTLNTDNTVGVYTKGLVANKLATNPFVISENDITKLDEKQVKAIKSKMDREVNKRLNETRKKLYLKRVAIDKRKDYEVHTKQLLNTTFNYYHLYDKGVLERANFDTTRAAKYYIHCGAQCCSSTRNTKDIITYIPKSWLNYLGYSLMDLKNWINFLEKCGMQYEARLLEPGTLKQDFPNARMSVALGAPTGNNYTDVDEVCYRVFISGKPCIFHTYFNFIVTRFIYSSIYWNIPSIAMKLKKNIPSLTHWECLITACANADYSGYYGLMANANGTICIPSRYNSSERTLERITGTPASMNACFRNYAGADGQNLRRAIKNEDFKTIEEIVKRYRDVD